MKTRVSVAAAALLFAISAAAQSALPNFSGTWNLDAAKSDFGMMPPPDSIVMVIDHQEPRPQVTATQKGPQGEASNSSTYTTDGKANHIKARGPNGEQDIASLRAWKGQVLE